MAAESSVLEGTWSGMAEFSWVNLGKRTKATLQEQDRACLQASRRSATLTLSPAQAFSTLLVCGLFWA